MPTVHEAIDAAINEATTALSRVNKVKSKQVRGVDDVATLKATAQTWFHTHRPIVAAARCTWTSPRLTTTTRIC